MSADFERLRDIFYAAVEQHRPDEWDAYLDQACAGDEELRRGAAALLKAHAEGHSCFDPAAPASDQTATLQPAREGPGTVIGPYKLMEQIGEGGMGLVFVAEQQHPVRRKVALKVIKPGMDTRAVIARFEAERQALALMDHPNIAKVLDAGETSSGRPYFVMELVKGVPITECCDQNQVPVHQRLELFGHVCQAVQHAHLKGIIHRDIKPSNVLVVSQDGNPGVKVIDFGVAKAIGQQLTDKTVYTHFAQLIGTPLYMSPEQAGESGLDIDTRSDIYSLGVLLYEMLTGTTPFDGERLRTVGYDEMRRIIREEEPPRPSTRISTLGQAATTACANRNSDPKQLSRLLRGELDWVVMKALEKDRNRRYESASALAADVRRYLADEPVQARPASAWYRLRKFVRRNRAALAPAALLLTVVVLGAVAAVWSLRERSERRAETERAVKAALTQAETLLEESGKQTEQPERWQATARLAQSAAARAEELLATRGGTNELAAEVAQLRAAVDAAAADSGLLVEVDRIRLEEMAVKGDRYDRSRAATRYAAVLRDYGLDLAAPEEAAARVHASRVRGALLAALDDWRRVTPDAAEQRSVEAVLQAIEPAPGTFRARWRAAAGRRDSATLVQLACEPEVERLPAADLVNLALDLKHEKAWAAAEQLLRAGRERFPGDFWLNHDLGMVLKNQGPVRAEEAARYFTAALALRSTSPGVFLNLGHALQIKGDLDGAIREYQAALRIAPKYAQAHNNLGTVLQSRGDVDAAVREFLLALDLDPNLANAHSNLGLTLQGKGDVDGAVREYHRALDLDPELVNAHYNLGNVLRSRGDVDGAVREYQAALRIAPEYAQAHNNLGLALRTKGDGDGAVREFRRALDLDPNLVSAHFNVGLAMEAKGDGDGAVREYQAALRIAPENALLHYYLGNGLRAKGDVDGAVREYRRALDLDPNIFEAHYNLGNVLRSRGDVDGAVRCYQAALRIAPEDAQALCNLGSALDAKGDVEGAIQCFGAALRSDAKYAEAHCNMGAVLLQKGQFAEALRAFRAGHELGSHRADWRYPSAAWIRDAERLAALDCKLEKVLKGEAQPASAAERALLGWLCARPARRLHVAAVGFYAAAFASDPKLADDLKRPPRYDAACAAALAGCGLGKDDPPPNAAAKEKLRQQALDWLKAQLAAYVKPLAGTDPKAPALVRQQLQHWQQDSDLHGVRDPDALAKLPEAERQAWQKLWDEVAQTLARAQTATVPEKKADMKQRRPASGPGAGSRKR
jgi:tetratricopeptide (TPR) repeat protein